MRRVTDSLPIIESCEGCGACCLEQSSPPGYVAMMANGVEAWPDETDHERFQSLPQMARIELEMYVEDLRADRLPGGELPCIWFDLKTRRCRYYEHRPSICRDGLLVNDEACRQWRTEYADLIKPVGQAPAGHKRFHCQAGA